MRGHAQHSIFAGVIGARGSVRAVVRFDRRFYLPRLICDAREIARGPSGALTVRVEDGLEFVELDEPIGGSARYLSPAFCAGDVMRFELCNVGAVRLGVSAVLVGEEDDAEGGAPLVDLQKGAEST